MKKTEISYYNNECKNEKLFRVLKSVNPIFWNKMKIESIPPFHLPLGTCLLQKVDFVANHLP